MSKTLVEQIETSRRERRREAAEKYFELLQRNSNPLDGDEEALAAAMDVLGRSPADLGDDVVLVSRIIDYEQLAPNVENLFGELQRKQVVVTNALRDMEEALLKLQREWDAKTAKLQQGYAQIESRWMDAKAARRGLAELKDKWDSIAFGKTVEQIQKKRCEDYAAIAPKPVHGPRVPSHVSRTLAESVGIGVGEHESGLAGSDQ